MESAWSATLCKITLFTLSFCQPAPHPQPGLHADLAMAISRSTPGGEVDMAAIARFSWDRLLILGPYADKATAVRVLPAAGVFEPSVWRDIERRDDICLLLFLAGDQVAYSLAYTRSAGDFSGMTGRLLSRSAARFRVSSGDGWVSLELARDR